MAETTENNAAPLDFIREMVAADMKSGKYNGKVVTRFPPEPNGYLHIGHAKAICLDFGIAAENNGVCHLRFDDTNPTKEDTEYEESIQNDVRWLGFDFGKHLYYASDYFERMYECAVELIKRGKAYVCDLSAEEWDEYRGDLANPGKESPGRKRSVEENLDLFARMRAGEFEDGAKVLRARIDMASPNINMRDPVIYRIRRAHHFRHGDKWCIYPMYDYAHPLEDAFEGVTHSLCTLEFEIHRPLYDWVLDSLGYKFPDRPQQTEFSRLNLTYTVMSKRKLLQLVKENHVHGWDDPRMPTLSGMRRRGIPASAIRRLCKMVGVTKFDGLTDVAVLEYCVREELNSSAPRFLAVLDPLKVTITNFPEEGVEPLDAVNNPEDPAAGCRKLAFTRELYIEKSDFMMEPPKGYFRLAPGKEVRLRYGYFIKCEEVVTDAAGNVIELKCSFDPATRGGSAPDGRKVKGTIHWVSASESVPAEVRLYDRLFSVEQPGADGVDFLTQLNADSLKVVTGRLEPELAKLASGSTVQFERLGYFTVDPDSAPGKPVFNRTVTLKDSWGNKLNAAKNGK
ncbi:glutamine--tRNA ligase/YqeY domain fusion protein [Victivallis vadensis]|uniref:Glutamine--tRNA ligase n=1 Tax=Victivallis vadensis TaxID=172901 RepID=A0A2U1BA94_9BACT|nr:glutamine--tRNA ligase/YqeY domain fusion protein [Victivallis vadensis]NMD88941.1 glutamine--tRNA ligase/YqeY domain fusion protein [Victivallis vadensis]PVY45586.1 glutaminyl-tRNA synthetase [Victivallis vadensis]HJH04952.1 glutamine--tRNA ligase/YqeY domain fusion protein [Victivallis vadensis]